MSLDGGEGEGQTEQEVKRGVFDFADGGRYTGEWGSEGAHGHGVCTLPAEGGVFEGLWSNGSQQSGVFTWSSGQRYIGSWKDGMRHGLGQEVRPDGTEYIGDFNENVRGVYGILKLANGALYQGTWADGLQDGNGVEIYADKGVYKGQYKKGQRCGFGTRSSSTYETYSKSFQTTTRDSNFDLITSSSSSYDLRGGGGKGDSTSSPSTSLKSANSSHTPAIHPRSSGSLKTSASLSEIVRKQNVITNTDSNTQIYEGQWEDDKRNGHGILKVPGRYDYFGEWKNNTRTGHGVVVYANGHREEGLWEDGRLTVPLKRKKLSLKYHQLETKVKQAHTAAVQAADMARTKANLAESRASGALGRSKAALKCGELARTNAQKASELSVELKKTNDSESGKNFSKTSPFSRLESVDSQPAPPTGSSSLLSVPSLSPTPSYEEFDAQLFESMQTSSSSDGEEEEEGGASSEGLRLVHQSSQDSKSDRGGISIRVTEERTFRKRLKHRGDSSSSVDSGVVSGGFKKRSHMSKQSRIEDEGLSLKRGLKEGAIPRRRRSYDPSIPRIDQTTGEVTNSTDNSDDESQHRHGPKGMGGDHEPLPHCSKPSTTRTQQSLNMDVITQMANWNKTIAYINFILLVFLLLLIVVVVAFMTTTLSQNNPASFMTHMA